MISNMLTDEEAKVIDYLFNGAEVFYSERKQYINAGGEPVHTFIADPSRLALSRAYSEWHLEDMFNGEVRILKIKLTTENRKRINEYLGIT